MSNELHNRTFPRALWITAAYCLAFVSLGLATAAIGPALPGLAENTGKRIGEIGFIFTGTSFGYMLGSLGFGNLLDRMRGNLLLVFILLTMTITLVMVPLISELWLLLVVLMVLGIAEGGLDVCANVLIVWVHQQKATPFLNALHFFFGIGAFLAPILIAQATIATNDIRLAFWILAVYPIPFILWLLRLPSPASPHVEVETENRSTPWLLVGLITFIFIFYVGAELGFGGWIYSFAIYSNLTDTAGAALLTSLFWGMLSIGRLLGIAISTRLRPAAILFFDLLGCLFSIGLIWLFPKSPLAVWGGTIAMGLFMASIFPTLLAFADRHMELTGKVSRWFFVGTGIGGMLLPWLLGVLIDQRGPAAIMPALWLNIGLAMVAFLGAVVLIRRRSQPGAA